ncbi:hypothetical protein [Cohnella sp. AR92]|uniref:hypothetical protein n=1 Tax=Cohnella sp. AR92 TaxID=648716 RepID=UPI000F8F5FE3|nr:hypothetical protein [Cohnella sp. AR92]RUS44558.1 hypothetical protein ELR57_22510 [Cohnella sp. AR92]
MNYELCEHVNHQYVRHSLICSDCKQSGQEQHLKDNDFPASFTEVHLNAETGFSVTRINNHVDKVTFFRSFDGNADYLGTFHDLQGALSTMGGSNNVSA